MGTAEQKNKRRGKRETKRVERILIVLCSLSVSFHFCLPHSLPFISNLHVSCVFRKYTPSISQNRDEYEVRNRLRNRRRDWRNLMEFWRL
ncbi:hypothetical protein JZ751_015119, partial [Albula glossodonta]